MFSLAGCPVGGQAKSRTHLLRQLKCWWFWILRIAIARDPLVRSHQSAPYRNRLRKPSRSSSFQCLDPLAPATPPQPASSGCSFSSFSSCSCHGYFHHWVDEPVPKDYTVKQGSTRGRVNSSQRVCHYHNHHRHFTNSTNTTTTTTAITITITITNHHHTSPSPSPSPSPSLITITI